MWAPHGSPNICVHIYGYCILNAYIIYNQICAHKMWTYLIAAVFQTLHCSFSGFISTDREWRTGGKCINYDKGQNDFKCNRRNCKVFDREKECKLLWRNKKDRIQQLKTKWHYKYEPNELTPWHIAHVSTGMFGSILL